MPQNQKNPKSSQPSRGQAGGQPSGRQAQSSGGSKPTASPTDVARALRGVDLPQNKRGLVEHAKKGDSASPEAVAVLEQIPDREYKTMADVEKGVGQVI